MLNTWMLYCMTMELNLCERGETMKKDFTGKSDKPSPFDVKTMKPKVKKKSTRAKPTGLDKKLKSAMVVPAPKKAIKKK